ncbi:IPTL-CTERM sorting domain-containing protein [Acidovorax sp. SDU_ACID1]|uniref:IPTL-CTERM sorting domain-containing protein n=1 Tax=Acidovorax sp. SDU_ACID1 TaxID=3136632 RepID=UPI00387335D2
MKLRSITAAALLCLSTQVFAAYTLHIYESGGDVVASGSGSINTAGLPAPTISNTRPLARGTDALVYIGGTTNIAGTAMDLFNSGVAGPTSFGTSTTLTYADAGLGDFVGILGDTGRMFVPLGYTSQSLLSSSAVWSATTLAALGLTPGTYTWTWGAGPTADSFTVQIGPLAAAAIPTLSEWALIGLSSILAMLGISRMRRRQG